MESSKGMGLQGKGGGKGRDGHRGINKERNGERLGRGKEEAGREGTRTELEEEKRGAE